ncbi:MAG: AAA family ATPase [Silicimonas sp.]|nr:AAA family ATPase [Silicimonas sp.]
MRSDVTYPELLSLVPRKPEWRVNWQAIWPLFPEFAALDSCPQDPVHHAEGDAGTHTRMVVEALVAHHDWRALRQPAREMLFWAACFHDIGKPATTRHEDDGRITSKGHSRLGANMTRAILREIGVPFDWREDICGIVEKHQLPFWLIERPLPERLAVQTSLVCRPDLLCLHAEADALGRICADQQAVLENVALARLTFLEAGCPCYAYPFENDESRLAFLESDARAADYTAFEDFRCDVTVMSGLPGAGKDTWIAGNCPALPVVSLDAVREALSVKPTDNQGTVIQAAYEAAREHLRAERDFVWNATNVTAQTRGKILRLLRDYGARIHIVYIEVPPKQLRKQNAARPDAVPDAVLDKLERKLEPPRLLECHEITYVLGDN